MWSAPSPCFRRHCATGAKRARFRLLHGSTDEVFGSLDRRYRRARIGLG
jgi:dTDP-D-glucose 4,6-dehydratase